MVDGQLVTRAHTSLSVRSDGDWLDERGQLNIIADQRRCVINERGECTDAPAPHYPKAKFDPNKLTYISATDCWVMPAIEADEGVASDIAVVDAASQKEIRRIHVIDEPRAQNAIKKLTVGKDGRRAVVIDYALNVIFCDLMSGKVSPPILTGGGTVEDLWVSDDSRFAVASTGDRISVWDLRSHTTVRSMPKPAGAMLLDCRLPADGDWSLLFAMDGDLNVMRILDPVKRAAVWEADGPRQKAEAYIAAGDWGQAHASLQRCSPEVLEQVPVQDRVLAALAANEVLEAADLVERHGASATTQPTSQWQQLTASVSLNVARLAASTTADEAAAELFLRACALTTHPQPDIRVAAAQRYCDLNRFDDARREIALAEPLIEPTSFECRTVAKSVLATMLHAEGHDAEAIETLDAAVAIAADDTSILLQRGNLLYLAKHYDAAIEDYRHVIRFKDDPGEIRLTLARALAARAEIADIADREIALRDVDEARALIRETAPTGATADVLRGDSHLAKLFDSETPATQPTK